MPLPRLYDKEVFSGGSIITILIYHLCLRSFNSIKKAEAYMVPNFLYECLYYLSPFICKWLFSLLWSTRGWNTNDAEHLKFWTRIGKSINFQKSEIYCTECHFSLSEIYFQTMHNTINLFNTGLSKQKKVIGKKKIGYLTTLPTYLHGFPILSQHLINYNLRQPIH